MGPHLGHAPEQLPGDPGRAAVRGGSDRSCVGDFVIAGDVARLVATALVTQMASAGFPTEGMGTPLEDGRYTLEGTGSTPGCKVQLTIKPMGGETFVTILYGAACPHD